MAISITVITTANRARRFLQTEVARIEPILDSFRRSGQIFSGKPLIIGSERQTEVFAAASIACVEIETDRDLSEHFPSHPDLVLMAMTPAQRALPFAGGLEGEHFKAGQWNKLA